MQLQLDTDVRALLEYSYDGQTRIANGLWRQTRHTDAVDFPYACVKVYLSGAPQSSTPSPAPLPAWLQGMVDDGRLVEMEEFSKFLFGCAGLLPDMVRAVPVWIDDPLVQRCLASQFFPDPPGQAFPTEMGGMKAKAPGLSHQGSHRSSQLMALNRRQAVTSQRGQKQAGPLAGLQGLLRSSSQGASVKGWQLKLLERRQMGSRSVYTPQELFVEGSLIAHNETVFIAWLSMSITLSGLACVVLGFQATAYRDLNLVNHSMLLELTAFSLLACGVVAAAFSIASIWSRSPSPQNHRYLVGNSVRDRRRGLIMALLIVGVFVALLVCNLYDLCDLLHTPTNPSPAPDSDDDGWGVGRYGAMAAAGIGLRSWRGVVAL